MNNKHGRGEPETHLPPMEAYAVARLGEAVVCEYCGLFREQKTGTEPGAFNDMGWWCEGCINRGYRRTEAQEEWRMFASDYPQFALELKQLRKRVQR